MTNFSRTQLDAVWVTGYQVTPADLIDLSRKAYEGVNGKRGGVYAPSSPIEVPPAAGDDGLVTTTMLHVRAAGVLRLETGAVLTLGDGDYQDLATNHPGRTRDIYQAMAPVRAVGENRFAIANLVPSGAVQPLASEIRRARGASTPEFVKEIRVHNGGRLTRITVGFKVPTPHASAPQEMPRVRVFRVRMSDGVEENLSAASADGFVSFTQPTSGTGWHAGGAYQEFAVTLDQNNTIDTSAYSYFIHVVEERAGVPEYPFQLQVWESETIAVASKLGEPNANTGDVDTRGSAWPSGSVALFKDQTLRRQNGLWVSPGGAGAWTRHPALSSEPHFRNGMLFLVSPSISTSGKSNPGTVWQMILPPPFVLEVSDIEIGPPVPRGTIFLGLTSRFEGITTTAPQ